MTNEYRFRFAFTPDLPGNTNMDLDRRLVSASPNLPIVRFYTWAGRSISLGCNQDPAKRLKLELCREKGIGIVQRPTGGREVLHGDDICYSVVWPLRSFERVKEAGRIFSHVNDILSRALDGFGVRTRCQQISRRPVSGGPCFALIDRGEITTEGKKLLASAQRIYDRVVLQQGSMLLKKPSMDITDFLRIDDPEGAGKSLEKVSTWFYRHVEGTFPIESIVAQFKEELERFFGSEPGPWPE